MMQQTSMLKMIANWFRRNFSNPEALGLFFTLLISFLLIELFGNILLPVFISIVIAYLLNSIVKGLTHCRCPHLLAVIVAYLLFLGLFLFALFGLMPLLYKQLSNAVYEFPHALGKTQHWIADLMQRYPHVFTNDPLQHIIILAKQQSMKIGQLALSYSLATIPGLITIVLYVVLVPILVFFFLKDGRVIASWITRYLPNNRGLVQTVWREVHEKIGAYVKGRVVEIIIIAIVTAVTFSVLGLQYAILMGALVGLSVIVPYIGAVVVTIPVIILGLMQWGLSAHFAYLLIAHVIIITLDANVLFPLLFAETVDLHPIIIILAVLFFGGIWGFWGVFFAIPLATLCKAVLNAWPKAALPDS